MYRGFTMAGTILPAVDKYLKKLYYTPSQPGSLGGARKLYEAVKRDGKYKLTLADIKQWLSGQETYSLHRPARKNFERNHVVTVGAWEQGDSDLMDLQRYAKQNNGIRFILIMIDVFSRYLWVAPLKSKSAEDMIKGLHNIFSQQKPRKLRTIRHDKGQEFLSKKVQNYLGSQHIHDFPSENSQIKANFAEIAIKYLKTRIFRYFTLHQTHRYIHILSQLVKSYNNTVHSATGVAPVHVNESNQQAIWDRLYLPPKAYRGLLQERHSTRTPKFQFKVGDYVRVSYIRDKFARGFDQYFSGEIFQIVERKLRQDIPVYKLRGYDGEMITGYFYSQELQRITYDKDALYKIDKIIKTRVISNRTQYRVSWQNWPSRYNSWIDSDQLKQLRRR